MKLDNKVALVVGSTSGIGKATAVRFADEGAAVIVTGRREDAGAAVVREIEGRGGKAAFMRLDVTDFASFDAFASAIKEEFGQLDAYVYNAGVATSTEAYLHDITERSWDLTMDTNLKGALFLTHSLAPLLRESRGAAVFTSSLAGISARGAGGGVCYGPGKAALSHLVSILALELAKDGVRVNAVAPGATKTDILASCDEETLTYLKAGIPLGTLGEPEDIANAMLFLSCDDSRFVTGQTLCVDGGASIS